MSLTFRLCAWGTSPGKGLSRAPHGSRIGARLGALGQPGLAHVFKDAIIDWPALLGGDRAQFVQHGVQQSVGPGETQLPWRQAGPLGSKRHEGSHQPISTTAINNSFSTASVLFPRR